MTMTPSTPDAHAASAAIPADPNESSDPAGSSAPKGLTKSSAPLSIGVLGCANIAKAFVRDVKSSSLVRIAAVASRNTGKAAEFAAAQGVECHHNSYEALLEDAGIDAIYLPLPNSLHAPWAIAAAEHGKHVLCEKPLALDRGQARAMFAAARANGVVLLEAYPYQFQPQTATLLAMLADATIGAVRSVQASFGFTLANPEHNIRLRPDLGGGALLDAGSYPLSLIRLVMGAAPEWVRADASWAPTGVDLSMTATLYYADGRRAQLACAMDTANHRRATIAGTQGTIETEYLNHTSEVAGGHPFGFLPSEMRVRRGIANSIPFETVASPVGSGFRFTAEAFARMVAQRDTAAFERAARMSIDNAATLAALAASARADGERVVVEV